MKPKEIQELIKFVAKSGVSEVEIESEGFKINIKTPPYKRGKQQQEPIVVQAQPQMAGQVPVQQVPVQQQPAQPQQQQQTQQPAAGQEKKEEQKEEKSEDSNVVEFNSPMIGTFYRSPSPDKPPFVSVGDEVKKGDVLCIIEAMKLFNEIEAEFDGKIVKVVADDASPVEYDQPLFLIEPRK